MSTYNHAFSIAFSLESDLTADEYQEYMRTKKGLSELGAHLIRRAMSVVQDGDVDAYDLWDTYRLDNTL
jgi:hypothetical protein